MLWALSLFDDKREFLKLQCPSGQSIVVSYHFQCCIFYVRSKFANCLHLRQSFLFTNNVVSLRLSKLFHHIPSQYTIPPLSSASTSFLFQIDLRHNGWRKFWRSRGCVRQVPKRGSFSERWRSRWLPQTSKAAASSEACLTMVQSAKHNLAQITDTTHKFQGTALAIWWFSAAEGFWWHAICQARYKSFRCQILSFFGTRGMVGVN